MTSFQARPSASQIGFIYPISSPVRFDARNSARRYAAAISVGFVALPDHGLTPASAEDEHSMIEIYRTSASA
jgi:hypothetical protein